VKHKTCNLDPRIRDAADELKITLFRRDGELWANGDVQLTYKYRSVNGINKTLTESERLNLALELLASIKAARLRWGTVLKRHEAVIAGLREVLPNYRYDNWCFHYEPSLDHGCIFREPFGLHTWSMFVDLVGCKQLAAKSVDPKRCLTALSLQSPETDGTGPYYFADEEAEPIAAKKEKST
jgi:hypothetical protein